MLIFYMLILTSSQQPATEAKHLWKQWPANNGNNRDLPQACFCQFMLPWGSVLQISLSTMIQSISLHAVLRNGHEQLNQILAQILACDIYVIPVISRSTDSLLWSHKYFQLKEKNVLNIMPKSKQWPLGEIDKIFWRLALRTMNYPERRRSLCTGVNENRTHLKN